MNHVAPAASTVASTRLVFNKLLLTLAGTMGLFLLADRDCSAQCVPPPVGIVAAWQAEGDASDPIGSNNGSLQNGTGFGGGMVGQAFSFDGVDDVISIPASSSLNVGAGSGLTIEGWIFPGDVTRAQAIAEWNDGNGTIGTHFWHSDVGIGGRGALMANLTDISGGEHILASPPSLLVANVYQHVAVTYDKSSGTARIYYNGATVETQLMSSFTPRTDSSLYLGARVSGGSAGGYFYGLIDEISIYDHALTGQEIQAIYNAGSSGKCISLGGPIFVIQPTNQTVFAGANATLVAWASGSPPLSYQWSFNGSPLLNATNTSLVLTNVGTNQAGNYSVEVTNPYDVIASSNAFLTVLTSPPLILTQPTNKTAAAGQTVSLVVGANGTPPLNYQWTFNGIPLPDATNASLVLTNLGTNQAGTYAVAVTNLYGFAISSNANLTVVVLSLNLFDDFEPNVDFDQWAALSTVLANNYGGFVSPSNSLWFGGTGSRFAITRVLNTTNGGLVQFSLRLASGSASTWETVDLPSEGVVLESSTNGGNTWLEFGRFDTSAYFNWTNISLSIPVSAQGPAAQFRWRQLANSGSPTDHWALDDVAIFTVPVAPTVVTNPQSQTVNVGSNAVFAVNSTGSLPLRYQWRFNGADIANATNSTFTVTNALPSKAGNYNAAITNAGGFAISSNALLKVRVMTVTGNNQPLTNSFHFFGTNVTVRLQSFFTNGLVFYTLDGSSPSFFSAQYSGPFVVTQSVSLRAIAYSADFFESGEIDPVAVLIPPSYPLSLTSGGGGTVSANPTPGPYFSNSVVTLTATPNAGWTFLQWAGDVTGNSAVTNITMNRAKSAKAIFGTSLGTTAAGGGSVALNPPGGFYPYGSTVQISAIPSNGNLFVLWGNAASGNVNPLLFTVTNANSTVSSVFSPVNAGQAALTVVPVGMGTIAVSPRANVYSTGSGVSISATPDVGQTFIGWSGDASGTQNPLSLTMNANKLIYANFSKQPRLTIVNTATNFPSEGVQLSITASLNDRLQLNASTNLSTWTPLATLTNSVGTISFIDMAATNAPKRFYQSIVLP